MHYAAGMGCCGVAVGLACSMLRRGYRWIPAAMTLGGVAALVPDMPRVFREDFYWHPVSSLLGSHALERYLHAWGDLFFFHRQLDEQPHEYALLGLLIILVLYNAAVVLLMRLEHRQRNSIANRAWRAHHVDRTLVSGRHATGGKTQPPTHVDQVQDPPQPYDGGSDVIYRIRPSGYSNTGDTGPA